MRGRLIVREAAGSESVTRKQCRKMQRNPGKQRLTDRLFRGFWIRECAHFHPVGQSPGRERRRTKKKKPKRMGGRKRIIRSEKHSEPKVEEDMSDGWNKDLNIKQRGSYKHVMNRL